MAVFCIEIAEVSFQVTSLFESTRDYCKNYLTEKEPDFSLEVFPEDLVFEQNFLDQEATEEGLKLRKFSDPFLERTAIQRKVADFLLQKDVVLFHGSGLALDGAGFLFTAACGTGKSTHARFWRETLGAVAVNDDKPFLKISSAGVTMFGAPWSGKHGLDANICVPLKGLCILERGTENTIRPATAHEALGMLQKQAYRPINAEKEAEFLSLTHRLADLASLWKLSCTKEQAAAQIAYPAMHK